MGHSVDRTRTSFKFASCVDVSSDDEAVIADGRSFHALAALTGKERSSGAERRVDGWSDWRLGVDGKEMTATVDISSTAQTVGNA